MDDLAAILRTLIGGAESDRWLMRVALLEAAGIEVSAENLAVIGGCEVDRAEGAIAGLFASGFVDPQQDTDRAAR